MITLRPRYILTYVEEYNGENKILYMPKFYDTYQDAENDILRYGYEPSGEHGEFKRNWNNDIAKILLIYEKK